MFPNKNFFDLQGRLKDTRRYRSTGQGAMNRPVRSIILTSAAMMGARCAHRKRHRASAAASQGRRGATGGFSFGALLPLILLCACAETQTPASTPSAPTPVASVAPTPSCNAPPSSQADRQNPATPWLRAVDRERLAECTDALDPRPAPFPPGHLGNPTQEAMDRRTLDLAPAGLPVRLFQGGEYRQRIPMPD